MQYINDYQSTSSTSSDEKKILGSREIRQVYLVTYSKADLAKFPTRTSFAEAVKKSFTTSTIGVVQWCCGRERHRHGGYHYHVAVKLSSIKRWLPSKKYLLQNYGVSVHFSNSHSNYYTAWKYVTKEDVDYETSPGHPDLSNVAGPSTSRAHEAMHERRKSKGKTQSLLAKTKDGQSTEKVNMERPGKRRKRLSAYQVSEIIISKGLEDRTALMAFANIQKNEGKTDLAEFVFNRGTRGVNELISSAWEMHKSEETIRRSTKSRLDLLREAAAQDCLCETQGLWEICALELLHSNDIPPKQFKDSLKLLLEKGRGKYRNIMLTGPANCGKTFLFNPLNTIYNTFCNPASSNFAWVGAEKAEVIFLNDFRWSPQIITWHDFLLLLEGQVVHLPAPKSHFAADVEFDRDTPIFCTTKQPLSLVKHGCVDETETEMMRARWVCYSFSYQIPRSEQNEMKPCPACFANMILSEEDD